MVQDSFNGALEGLVQTNCGTPLSLHLFSWDYSLKVASGLFGRLLICLFMSGHGVLINSDRHASLFNLPFFIALPFDLQFPCPTAPLPLQTESSLPVYTRMELPWWCVLHYHRSIHFQFSKIYWSPLSIDRPCAHMLSLMLWI